MSRMPWDQRLARVMVRPLAARSVSPHTITTVTLILGIGGSVFLAAGERWMMHLGAGLFVLARFLDHFDGELARQTGRASRAGYYYDYIVGGLTYAALFFALGYGFRGGALGDGSIVLGAAAALAALVCLSISLDHDERVGDAGEPEAVGYPAIAGFELEDGIYLLAPITWLGWLEPFFLVSSVGAVVYLAWTLRSARRVSKGTNSAQLEKSA